MIFSCFFLFSTVPGNVIQDNLFFKNVCLIDLNFCQLSSLLFLSNLNYSSSSSVDYSPDSTSFSDILSNFSPSHQAFFTPSPAFSVSSFSLHCGAPLPDSPTGLRPASDSVDGGVLMLSSCFSTSQVHRFNFPPMPNWGYANTVENLVKFYSEDHLTLSLLSAGQLCADRGLPVLAMAKDGLYGVWRTGLWISLRGRILRGLQGLLQKDRTGWDNTYQ